jgi:glutathione peroxidase
MPTAHDFTATTIEGDSRSLSDYAGRLMLVVNVASKCGFTAQYEGLERLQRQHSDDLVVLGFPCDQFGNQEPGHEEEIQRFCSLTYGVTFPMFAKIEVIGDGAHPLYSWLRLEEPGPDGRDIEWNFTKFLLGRDGRTLKRYEPEIEPEEMLPDIERAAAA